MTAAGWLVALALAVEWLFRRRGDFEVWAGHAHLYSNRPLDEAFALCEGLWSGGPDDSVRAVVRRGGEELCWIDWRDEVARRARNREGREDG